MSSDDNLSKGPTSAAEYVPRYVNLADVPIERENASHDVGATTKRLALKEAESQFENDVNGGDRLVAETPDDLPGGTWAAVRNLASAVIYHPALSPRDGVNLGEVSEYGEQQYEYVSRYLERYNSLVTSINAVDEDDDAGPGEDHNPDFEFRTF